MKTIERLTATKLLKIYLSQNETESELSIYTDSYDDYADSHHRDDDREYERRDKNFDYEDGPSGYPDTNDKKPE